MNILEIVKTLLNIKDELQDGILNLYINIVEQNILNYCNIKELPDELVYVAAQMVTEMYNETTKDGKNGGLSSISEGGRTLSFNSSLVTTLTENKINERKTQLNRFRLPYR